MKTHKRLGDVLRALCAELTEEDGVRPDRGRGTGDRTGPSRKDMQLCKQVMLTLRAALSGEASSALLRELEIEAVEPAPDATRVRVVVRASEVVDRVGVERVLAELGAARGFLRVQIAGAISRKRVPQLMFVVGPKREEVMDG